jgi:hypothetical protein
MLKEINDVIVDFGHMVAERSRSKKVFKKKETILRLCSVTAPLRLKTDGW